MPNNFTNCAICYCEVHNIPSDISPDSPVNNNFLENNLNTIFILQHIFNATPKQFESYLRKWGSPEQWLLLCGKCEEDVINARRIFEKFHKISRELERRKWSLQKRVLVSDSSDKEKLRIWGRCGIFEILHQCRTSFYRRPELRLPSSQSPFVDGDLKASELALASTVQEDIKPENAELLIKNEDLEVGVGDNQCIPTEDFILVPEVELKEAEEVKADQSSFNPPTRTQDLILNEDLLWTPEVLQLHDEKEKDSFKDEHEDNQDEGVYHCEAILEDEDIHETSPRRCLEENEDPSSIQVKEQDDNQNRDEDGENVKDEEVYFPSESTTLDDEGELRIRFGRRPKSKSRRLNSCESKSKNENDRKQHEEEPKKIKRKSVRKRKAGKDPSSKLKSKRSKKSTVTPSKVLLCPVCKSRFPLHTLIPFSAHLQQCIPSHPSNTTSTSLNCSICNCWSSQSASNNSREFMEHVALCRDNDGHKSSRIIPWRHAVISCTLCPDKASLITYPDLALHINHYHQHKFSCSQCSWRCRDTSEFTRHWRRYHKDLLETPVPDRYKKDPDGTTPQLPKIPWWCPALDCLKEFSNENEEERDEHLKICEAFTNGPLDRSEKCTFCIREYFSPEELLIHRISVHGYRDAMDHKCGECNQYFQGTQQLRAHQRIEHNMNLLHCKDCGEEFWNPMSLRRHVVKEHGTKEKVKEFACHICPRSYMKEFHLRQHIKKEHEGESSTSTSKEDESSLTSHMNIIHAGESYPCPKEFCGKVHRTSLALKKHISVCHSSCSSSRTFKCSFCGRSFARPGRFRLHLKSCTLRTSLQCYRCKLRFLTEELLQEHRSKCEMEKAEVVEDEGESKSQLPCPICLKPCKLPHNLKRHIESMHENKRVQCDLCDNTQASNAALRRHKAEIHGIGNYPCGEGGCSKVFSSQGFLDSHQRLVHEDLKDFTCSFCGKSFHYRQRLRMHEQAMHLNAESKPFKCRMCGNRFPTKQYCIYHVKHVHKIKEDRCSYVVKE